MRADLYLFQCGYVKSRQKAQDLIRSGSVKVDGVPIKKSALDIDEKILHKVEISDPCTFASRGGLKLDAAIQTFRIPIKGTVCADIGASTGGFTDCLLRYGAKRVYAIDSGSGQLAEHLASDERVVSIEKCNARYLTPETLGETCDLSVMDVSFISQTYILPSISEILKEGGHLISLIKPQFEAGREALSKHGVVQSSAYRFLAVRRVLHAAEEEGFYPIGLIRSPVRGGDGNIEYLAAFEKRAGQILTSPISDGAVRRLTAQSDP